MSTHFVWPTEHITMTKVRTGVHIPRSRAIRLYCYQSGSMWNLQIRAPINLAGRKEGKDFIVATASLMKADLLALREAIDAAIAEAES